MIQLFSYNKYAYCNRTCKTVNTFIILLLVTKIRMYNSCYQNNLPIVITLTLICKLK